MTEASDALTPLIRSRRVVRAYATDPVSVADLRTVLDAARWALAASNGRIIHCLVIRDRATIGLLGKISPGMSPHPPALIVLCIDHDQARRLRVQLEKDTTVLMDVGAAMMNMSLAAHALGLGTCPVTSFSRAGVRTLLDLPQHLSPEVLLQVGHPSPTPPPRVRRPGVSTRYTVDDFTSSERIGERLPAVDE